MDAHIHSTLLHLVMTASYLVDDKHSRQIYAPPAYQYPSYKHWLFNQHVCGFSSRCCGKAIDACACFVSPCDRSFTARGEINLPIAGN